MRFTIASYPKKFARIVLLSETGFPIGTVWINDKDEYTVGRGEECDIVCLDGHASRLHCTLTWRRDGLLVLKDGGSLNGCYLNDRRIESHAWIQPGDEVEIGSTRLRFEACVEDDESEAPSRPPAPDPRLADDVTQRRPAPQVVEELDETRADLAKEREARMVLQAMVNRLEQELASERALHKALHQRATVARRSQRSREFWDLLSHMS